jgi:hypothetical protein
MIPPVLLARKAQPPRPRDRFIVCTFEAVEIGPAERRDYEAFRHAVLRAGRFSVFEATATDRIARFYARLCRDPEIETIVEGFPWTRVRPMVTA